MPANPADLLPSAKDLQQKIAMAESEKSDGVHKGALRLADAIIETQTAEIKRMRAMLS